VKGRYRGDLVSHRPEPELVKPTTRVGRSKALKAEDVFARIAELEARLQVSEDDRAIRQLLARYGFNADRVGRGEAYVSLYTEDGAIDISNTQRWEGHAALLDFITNPQVHGRVVGRTMHVLGNNLVTHIEGSVATAEGYSIVLIRERDGIHILTCNANRWSLEKIAGGWYIRERVIRPLGSDEFATVLSP
jgi:SnoaL-like domain